MSQERQRKEIEMNYKIFKKMLPKLLAENRGKFALFHHGELKAVFDTAGDAYIAGRKMYKSQPFSIQEIIETPADLGFYSHALPKRQI
jgi:hypothetical protein